MSVHTDLWHLWLQKFAFYYSPKNKAPPNIQKEALAATFDQKSNIKLLIAAKLQQCGHYYI